MIATKVQQLCFFIRLPNGNGSAFQQPLNLTLQQLVQLLEQTSLQLPSCFRLIYKGRRVKNYSITLQQLGVKDNSIIHIEPHPEPQQRSSKIDVAFLLDGDKFVVQESKQKTIWDLKQSISVVTQISPAAQILVFLGKKLKNHNTLQHYKITSDCLLCLLVDSNEVSVKPSSLIANSQCLDLMNSVTCLQRKSTIVSQKTLFRSDSINNRNVEQIAPFQVEIHEKKVHRNASQLKFDLFNSYRCSNLKGSITFNHLYDSLRPKCQKQQQKSQQQELEDFLPYNALKIPTTRVDLVVCEEYKSIELDE